MLALFYIFIAVAVGLGIWQLNRLSSYKQVILNNDKGEPVNAIAKSEENPVATEKDNDIHGKFFLIFLIGFYLLMTYCLFELFVDVGLFRLKPFSCISDII